MNRRKIHYRLQLSTCIFLTCIIGMISCGNKVETVGNAEEIQIYPEEATLTENLSEAAIPEETVPESSAPEEPISDPTCPDPTCPDSTRPDSTSSDPTAPDLTSTDLTIRMIGDILLHDRVAQYALQEDGTYQFAPIFDALEEEIREADLAIVNQEVIIAGEDFGVTGYPCFNAPFELGDALVEAGFHVICHATNHALDKGKAGLLSCIRFWKTEYPETAVLGIQETAEEQDEIYIYEQDGIKVAVLNYTYGTNGIPLPADMPYAVNLLKEEEVVADIEKAEMLADFTIVCPHWGTEYVLEETQEQRRWARLFLEHGVDLVLGTHPHVIEPIEIMKDEETGHEMLVYYSLGNFVNWTSSSGTGIANRMVGGMADVTIGFEENGEVGVKEYSVTAVVTHLEDQVNGVYTTRLSDYSEELALQNKIVLQDPAFSKEYCVDLCDKVWGELWK